MFLPYICQIVIIPRLVCVDASFVHCDMCVVCAYVLARARLLARGSIVSWLEHRPGDRKVSSLMPGYVQLLLLFL